MKCKNCFYEFKGNYCPSCGQKATVKRFSIQDFLGSDALRQIFQFEKGFVYTLKRMLLNPGEAIQEYLAGARKKYFHHIGFLLLLSSFVFLLSGFIDHSYQAISFVDQEVEKGLQDFLNKYQKITVLLLIPVFAIISLLVYRKSEYNYSEHIVINTYATAMNMFISAGMIVMVLMGSGEMFFMVVGTIFIGLSLLYAVFFFYKAFQPHYERKLKGIVLAFLIVVLNQVSSFGLLLLLAKVFSV